MKSNKRIPKTFIVLLWSIYLFCATSSSAQYTTEEKISLEKFRPLVQNIIYRDYMNQDHFLIRWLRARDLDIPKAQAMLTKAINWRKENKIDTILNETILEFPVISYYHDSISYSGNIVSTINNRALEMRKLISEGKRAKIMRRIDQTLEIGEVAARFWGDRFPTARQLIVIHDLNGYNIRQHGCLPCILVYQEWLRHYEAYYPQLLKQAIVVNTPRVFKHVLKAFKPFLSPHSEKILTIYGQNKQEWSKELFKIVPRNQLRRGLGGTKPDYVPCADHDFVCTCKIFLKTAGRGTNTTISLSAGLRRLDKDIC